MVVKTRKAPSNKTKIILTVLIIFIGTSLILAMAKLTFFPTLFDTQKNDYNGINIPTAIKNVQCPGVQIIVWYSTPHDNHNILYSTAHPDQYNSDGWKGSYQCGERPNCDHPAYYPYGDTTDQMYELACYAPAIPMDNF
jgi:hypothetical protein